MTDFPFIETVSEISSVTVTARVSIEAPLVKRLLIAVLADGLERDKGFSITQEHFFALATEAIIERGTESFSYPEPPDCSKIPGGIDRLLRETTAHWQQWFPTQVEEAFAFPITFSLQPEDIIRAFACSLTRGVVTACGDSPDTDDPERILHHVISARIECGEDFTTVGSSSDQATATATVSRAFPHLFTDFECGHGACISHLEF